jgi:hypothetical protein
MAHNCKLGDAAVQAEGDALAVLFNNGYLRIYDDTGSSGQPASPDLSLGSKVLLAELRFAATAVISSVNGVITMDTITPDASADASGTAFMYRVFKSDGSTPVCDGLCGVVGSGSDCELSTLSIFAGISVSISSFIHTVVK